MIFAYTDKAVQVWACVLIGGQSRRMGQPKHLLEQDGQTWVERSVRLLSTLVERVVIAGSGDLPQALAGISQVDDVADIGGPLAGMLAVFRSYPDVSWLMAACDLPDMEVAALQWLLAQRCPGTLAVMPDLDADGRIEPLLAYYDRQCRPLLESMAASGQRRLSHLSTMQGVITPQPPPWLRHCWRNVNTPQELEPFCRRA